MADNRNYTALDWVIGEIEETLKQARQSLEAYVDNPQDSTRIRFCLTHIHQVHGSLQMLEFFGAALLAEEMEAIAQALMNGEVKNPAEAHEVLMRAILQLPVYLDQVKARRNDDPGSLLPILNDLRAARGSSLLSESQFFNPDISPALLVSGEKNPALANPAQFKAIVDKLRQMYQYAAAGVIRGVKVDDNLQYLQKVFGRLYTLTSGTRRQVLWDVALAVVEGIDNEDLELSVSLKSLLRQLDREIRLLVEHGVKALDSYTREELIKNLLYYVARSESDTPRAQRLRRDYALDAALPTQASAEHDGSPLLAGPDPETMRTVVAALKDELGSIKEALDTGLSGRDEAAINDALPVMKRVADTLAVLGLADLRRQILDQAQQLELAQSQGTPEQALLMSVADRILSIEQDLEVVASTSRHDGQPPTSQQLQISQAQETVLREARNGLEQAKDSIIEYIASQWDRSHLHNVPQLLEEIRGGLSMIPLPRPAAILQGCSRYIANELLAGDSSPEWGALDTLADAIASVEYFLERLGGDRDDDDEMLLTLAEESIASLGYAVTGGAAASGRADHSQADMASVVGKLTDVEDVAIDALPHSSDGDDNADEYNVAGAQDRRTEEAADSHEEEPMGAPATADQSQSSAPEPGAGAEASVPTAEPPAAADAGAQDEYESEPAAEAPLASGSDSGGPEDEVDEEILEIFVEEAGEVLAAIDEHFPRWAADFDNTAALTEFRRAFHTLKGSGRMVGADDIGELAWAIESMLNRVLDGSVQPHAVQAELIRRVRAVLPDFIHAFEHKQPNPDPQQAQQLAAWGEAVSRGEHPSALQDAESSNAQVEDDRDSPADEEEADSAENNAILWEIFGSEAITHLRVVSQFVRDMEAAAPIYTPPSENMQRALHTLKGSAHMADVHDIAELATPLERFAKELRTYQVNIDDDILQLFRDGVSYTEDALLQIREGGTATIPRLSQFLARVAELRDLFVGPLIRQQEQQQSSKLVDPELLSIFMAEEMDLLLDADQIISGWQQQPQQPDKYDALVAELDTLGKGAERACLEPMAELSQQLSTFYRSASGRLQQLPEDGFASLLEAHEELLDMVDAVAAGQNIQEVPVELGEQLLDLQARFAAEEENTTGEETADKGPFDPGSVEDETDLSADVAAEYALDAESFEAIEYPASGDDSFDIEYPQPEPAPAESPVVFPAEEVVDSARSAGVAADEALAPEDDVDAEIIDIFLEEADELMEDIEQAVHDWSEDWSRNDCAEALKRALHTLKGGARLSGMVAVGNIAHDFETDIIQMSDSQAMTPAFFAQLNAYQDQLLRGIDAVKAAVAGDGSLSRALRAAPETTPLVEGDIAAGAPAEDVPGAGEGFAPPAAPGREAADSGASILPFVPKDNVPVVSSGGDFQLPTTSGGSGSGSGSGAMVQPMQTRRSAPQEVVKVSAELLEELVNLAGETSISRGRMEEQVSELGFAIDEMDMTIHRLQEQLRRLDIETEAQVLFRQEQMAELEEFDPLEMDRYSQLQQLSRSLIESASDLLDLKNTLADKTRDAETLLLQQSRINTDLQEGLMRSRMVPFSRMVPRLRRIVRQVAGELDKRVNFELDNVEGELDRTVLERMVAPLEHMLRNAVDHGIETPAERIKAGKPESGRIILTLGREGGDVVLRLIDDGRGINLERVRAKAIERGLMSAEARLSDREVMQFILHAGFSTAESVTQISGRGVGMDVVHSEIKQLGGSMAINSRWGEGTEFTVRLPFTVSVNRALMVRIGDDRYAVPLNTIEGIVRVSPFELEHYYQDPRARFEYAGEQYKVNYLGHLLKTGARPKLEGQAMPLPVVLVRSAQHAVALQVDMLMGSREVVVKSLGPQFANVLGVSGATVMGDGSVVVILDPHAMIRQDAALAHDADIPLELTAEPREVETLKKVMVVDDSVTVRKVTTRFLEREGYEVITAKDGVDALQQLQEHLPDVMLLDIEMPRMDGFEVAQNVRSSSRLKQIPIIMITSRTGDKHRQRALSLGVDRYLGKPYQEEKLLRTIRVMTGEADAESENVFDHDGDTPPVGD